MQDYVLCTNRAVSHTYLETLLWLLFKTYANSCEGNMILFKKGLYKERFNL